MQQLARPAVPRQLKVGERLTYAAIAYEVQGMRVGEIRSVSPSDLLRAETKSEGSAKCDAALRN
jgi:hypothetical protein